MVWWCFTIGNINTCFLSKRELGSANAETGVTISVHRHDSILRFVGTLWNGAKWIATSLKHQNKWNMLNSWVLIAQKFHWRSKGPIYCVGRSVVVPIALSGQTLQWHKDCFPFFSRVLEGLRQLIIRGSGHYFTACDMQLNVDRRDRNTSAILGQVSICSGGMCSKIDTFPLLLEKNTRRILKLRNKG